MDADEPGQSTEELVEEGQGHGRAAWPNASALVKSDMGVIGPYRSTSPTMATSATASSPTRPCASAWSSIALPHSTPTSWARLSTCFAAPGSISLTTTSLTLGPTMTEHLNVHGRYYFDLTSTPTALRPAPQPSTVDQK